MNGHNELFDLDSDPGEKTDLAQDKPEVVAVLATKLHEWQGSVLKSLSRGDYTP